MTRPIVAVTSDFREMAPYMWHAAPSAYIDAATDVAEVIPLIVPSTGARLDIDSLLDRVDGVLATGSRSNVHPSLYGQEALEEHPPFDTERDSTTLPLIRRAVERGVPLLAICRGIQELNVAFGGTLTAAFQKRRNLEGHGYPWEGTNDERFSLAHDLQVKPGGCLAQILHREIGEGPVRVNSLHTQALNKLGKGVVVEALAPDGTVEAVSMADAPGFVVGVQWHPEYWAASDQPSNTLLRAFGDAARSYLAARHGLDTAAE